MVLVKLCVSIYAARKMLEKKLPRDEKLDLLHFRQESKVKSNMVLALTSPLTRVKDVAKYISSLLTPLTTVKVKSNW